jgi:hypothetical protein
VFKIALVRKETASRANITMIKRGIKPSVESREFEIVPKIKEIKAGTPKIKKKRTKNRVKKSEKARLIPKRIKKIIKEGPMFFLKREAPDLIDFITPSFLIIVKRKLKIATKEKMIKRGTKIISPRREKISPRSGILRIKRITVGITNNARTTKTKIPRSDLMASIFQKYFNPSLKALVKFISSPFSIRSTEPISEASATILKKVKAKKRKNKTKHKINIQIKFSLKKT